MRLANRTSSARKTGSLTRASTRSGWLTASLLSKMPLVWVSSCRRVIRFPKGNSPGSQRATVSSRLSWPCSASCRTSTAVQVLLTLSSRMRASTGMGWPVAALATPAAPDQVPWGPATYAVAPGAIRPLPLVSPSSTC
jgi:hypothetical protein